MKHHQNENYWRFFLYIHNIHYGHFNDERTKSNMAVAWIKLRYGHFI